MKWIRITPVDNIPPREGRSMMLAGRDIAIFNLGDRFAAIENKCPHGGGPLADGIVGGSTVTCPLHNWRICLDSGQVTKPCEHTSELPRVFPVKVEDGIVHLQM